MKRGLFKYIIFVLVVLPALAFMVSVFATNINAKWRTVNEDNGYVYGSFARSHLIYGLRTTFGQDFFYTGPESQPKPYLHHPPGVALTLAVFLKIFGNGNFDEAYWQERMMPIIFHLASLFLTSLIVFLAFKSFKAVFLSSWLFALIPMSLYYGRMVNSEAPTLFFLILTTFLYVGNIKSSILWRKYLFLIPLVFACFYEWVGFYFIPAVIFLDIIDFKQRRIKDGKLLLNLLLFETLMFILIVGQIFIADHYSFKTLAAAFWQRTATGNVGEMIHFLVNTYLSLFTPLIGIPAFVYLTNLLYKNIFRGESLLFKSWQKLVIMFFLIALIHVFLWPNGAQNHFFWQIYFLPAIVISCTYFFIKTENFINEKAGLKYGSFFLGVFYIICIAIFLIQAQPITYNLYTGDGKFSFSHFYLERSWIK